MNCVSVLRRLALIEGVSYLLLLGVAMPLKYIWAMPLAVRIVGLIHGLLFLAVCLSLGQTMRAANWPWSRAAIVFVAALLPFGPWLVDGRMKQWERERAQAGAPD